MVNHGLAAKLATDFCLLKSSGRLFSYGKFTASFLFFVFFFYEICCFSTLLKLFFSSLKLNFMNDGILFFARRNSLRALKRRLCCLWSLKWPLSVIKSHI